MSEDNKGRNVWGWVWGIGLGVLLYNLAANEIDKKILAMGHSLSWERGGEIDDFRVHGYVLDSDPLPEYVDVMATVLKNGRIATERGSRYMERRPENRSEGGLQFLYNVKLEETLNLRRVLMDAGYMWPSEHGYDIDEEIERKVDEIVLRIDPRMVFNQPQGNGLSDDEMRIPISRALLRRLARQ